MKKPIASIIILISVSLLLAGTAFASAPDAASYFTDLDYNKTYTGSDGLEHTMSVAWVGETWNKVGTVIYSINYEDVYQEDGNTYIDAKSSTEIYENARPSYPDSTQYCVYSVNWYASGSSEVVSDYRTSSAEETTTTPKPEPASTPSATDDVTVPTENRTSQEPTYKSEAAAVSPSVANAAVSPDPTPSEKTTPKTPVNTPVNPKAPTSETKEAAASGSTLPEDKTGSNALSETSLHTRWVWPTVILSGLFAAIALACYFQMRRRKGCENDENPKT